MDRSSGSVRDGHRRFAGAGQSGAATPAGASAPAASPSALPVTRDASVKLSPDTVPPKSTERP
jgi:hypothetical protein